MEERTYSIGEVSGMSGASMRTLRHYEKLGLLKPSRRPNGYREFKAADIERLQQILLFRACGMGLESIGRLLNNPGFDAQAALERHLGMLEHRRNELDDLMETVQKTLRAMKGECDMTDSERFEGLKRRAIEEGERAYGAEARERYGNEAVNAHVERLQAMDERQWTDMNELESAITGKLAALLEAGDDTGPAADELAALHRRWLTMHWGEGAYSREAHLQLARGYLADRRFKEYYDSRSGEGATELLVRILERFL